MPPSSCSLVHITKSLVIMTDTCCLEVFILASPLNFSYTERMKNKVQFVLEIITNIFIRNRKPSPVLEAILRTTHSSWVQSLQDTNRITDYEYKLWS